MSDELREMEDRLVEKFDPTLSQTELFTTAEKPKNSDNPEHGSPSTQSHSVVSEEELMSKFNQYMGDDKQEEREKGSEQKGGVDDGNGRQEKEEIISYLQQNSVREEVIDQEMGSELDLSKSKVTSNKPIDFESEQVQEGDPEDGQSYRSLSQKLEMALSRLKKSPTEISSQFAARQQQFIKRKNSDLNLLRLQKQKEDSLKYTNKPLLNSKSMQLLNHYKPIQTRYKDVLGEKKKKIDKSIAEKKAKQAEEEQAILKKMKQHEESVKNKFGKDIRSGEDYYAWMQTWAQVRDKKVEEMAYKQGINSLKATTFKPKLNEKSEVLMKKKPRVPVYEQQPNIKKVRPDKNCTFKPNLNKTMKK